MSELVHLYDRKLGTVGYVYTAETPWYVSIEGYGQAQIPRAWQPISMEP